MKHETHSLFGRRIAGLSLSPARGCPPPLHAPPTPTMFTSMHVSKTLALRPEGPSYDAHVEGEKERQKNVTR